MAPPSSWTRTHLKKVGTKLECKHCVGEKKFSWEDRPGALSNAGTHLRELHKLDDPNKPTKYVQQKLSFKKEIEENAPVTQEEFDNALIDWIVHENIPFLITDSQKFLKVLHLFGRVERGKVPCRQTIADRIFRESVENVPKVS